jgi:C4-dicarboxylate transporter DctM subunit
MVAIVIFSIMLGLLILNVPVAMTIAFATLGGIAVIGGQPLMIVIQRMFTGLDTFTLIAIPLFILAGRLMAAGGVTKDLINVAKVVVGFLKGGLAYVNVMASLLGSGMTGSAAADTSSCGTIMIPVMKEKGYDTGFTAGITATSSTIGIMIPPSIPLVVYGVTTNTSIGRLFIAGFVPGILTFIALIIVVTIVSKKHDYPREEKVPIKEAVISVIRGIPAMLTVVIIIGGIRGGFFTPTEGAGMAATYAFLLGTFYYRQLKLTQIPKIIVEVAITTGQVALMIATASALGWLFARQGIPAIISQFLLGVTTNRILLLLIINLMLLIIGMFLDLSPAVIIFAPILLPIAVSLGIDPVHFGLIMTVNLAIGLCTPPAGVCLFIACGIAKTSITSVLKGFIAPLLAMVVVLMLITYIPQLTMFLPNLLMN